MLLSFLSRFGAYEEKISHFVSSRPDLAATLDHTGPAVDAFVDGRSMALPRYVVELAVCDDEAAPFGPGFFDSRLSWNLCGNFVYAAI